MWSRKMTYDSPREAIACSIKPTYINKDGQWHVRVFLLVHPMTASTKFTAFASVRWESGVFDENLDAWDEYKPSSSKLSTLSQKLVIIKMNIINAVGNRLAFRREEAVRITSYWSVTLHNDDQKLVVDILKASLAKKCLWTQQWHLWRSGLPLIGIAKCGRKLGD